MESVCLMYLCIWGGVIEVRFMYFVGWWGDRVGR